MQLDLVGSSAGGAERRFIVEVKTGGKRKEVVKNRLERRLMIGCGLA